jgi:hypothetical protein
MSAGRKVTDARDARACLKAAKSAGMARGEWARAHGIDGRSLHAWELNLSRGGEVAEASPRLLELVPAPASRSAARYLVRVGEYAVEFGDDFDEATLVRLVRALGTC